MRIYVGGLPYSTDETALRSLFEEFGAVGETSVVSDRYSGQSKGFGFVEMADDAEARAAIAGINGREMNGRSLAVSEAKPREDRPSGGGGRGRGAW